MRTEATGIVSWVLNRGQPFGGPPQAEPPPLVFRPGQYSLVGQTPLVISGDPVAGELVHTFRSAVVPALQDIGVGDMVDVTGPLGTSWPDAEERDLILVGGGTGMCSLRPLICQIYHHRRRYGRVAVTVGARSPEFLLFADEFDMWRAAGIEIFVIVDTRPPGWKGRIGQVTQLIQRLGMPHGNCLTLLSGSELMVRFAVRELLALGHVPDSLTVSLARNFHHPSDTGRLEADMVMRDGPVFSWPAIKDWLRVAEG